MKRVDLYLFRMIIFLLFLFCVVYFSETFFLKKDLKSFFYYVNVFYAISAMAALLGVVRGGIVGCFWLIFPSIVLLGAALGCLAVLLNAS